MNRIDEALARYRETKDASPLGGYCFVYMDGCPGDFEFAAPFHTLALVHSEARSQLLLQSASDSSIYRFGPMKSWSDDDNALYRKKVRRALKTGSVNCISCVDILRFCMKDLAAHGERLMGRHLDRATAANFIETYVENGRTRHILKQCPGPDGSAIRITHQNLLTLLLWAEFIIFKHERLEWNARQTQSQYDGLVVISDFICGDNESRAKLSYILRAATNDAYRDRITFCNTKASDTIVGDLFADNMSSFFQSMDLNEIGSMWIHESSIHTRIFVPTDDFHFRCVINKSLLPEPVYS